jgi:predicted TPR repeat methyltransferase/thioredoxin-like negative regulator of GroEL
MTTRAFPELDTGFVAPITAHSTPITISKDRNVSGPKIDHSAAATSELILDAAPKATSSTVGQLEEARVLLDQDDHEGAWAICDHLIQMPDLPLNTAVKVALLAKEIGQTEIAEAIFSDAYTQITTNLDRIKDPEHAMLPAAEALADMGYYDDAEALCRKAIAQAPDNLTVAVGYVAFLVYRKRENEAVQVADTFHADAKPKFDIAFHFATIFDHLGGKAGARAFLERAETHCKTKTQRARLDFLSASVGLSKTDLDQHGMAVELFDGFAKDYDKQLTKLDNNGPSMVFTALEELQLPKNASRRILDAGCGTGLCAGFLRPYAKELFGVDLSVKMLEISREKGGYDFLARTDLSEIVTFPEGKFDMIVCADVLTYFGALNIVIGHFSKILAPGGWLLLTVENENDPKVPNGFKLYSSGRHKHTVDYMTKTLTGAGFSKPKLLKHARLRNELGAPIYGTLIAVQKPALLFG